MYTPEIRGTPDPLFLEMVKVFNDGDLKSARVFIYAHAAEITPQLLCNEAHDLTLVPMDHFLLLRYILGHTLFSEKVLTRLIYFFGLNSSESDLKSLLTFIALSVPDDMAYIRLFLLLGQAEANSFQKQLKQEFKIGQPTSVFNPDKSLKFFQIVLKNDQKVHHAFFDTVTRNDIPTPRWWDVNTNEYFTVDQVVCWRELELKEV